MAERAPYLSVLVTSFNQYQLLRPLVEQLLAQDFDTGDFEVLVVDDASTDETPAWLRSRADAHMRPLLLPENCGRAVARNAAVSAARGEILVMIDGDHSVQQDFLSVHAARHRRERCVVVGKSVYEDKPDFRAVSHYLNGCGAAKYPSGSRLPGRYFLTRNCSLPRDLLFQVGRFDEQFRVWGGEDLDLGIRLAGTGVPIYAEPRALAIHHHLRPPNDLLDNMYVYGREGIPLLLKRHPQLFEELNLHQARHPWLRFLMTAPVYHAVRLLSNMLRTGRVPRILFDYLHLRQYARGYDDYLKSKSGD